MLAWLTRNKVYPAPVTPHIQAEVVNDSRVVTGLEAPTPRRYDLSPIYGVLRASYLNDHAATLPHAREHYLVEFSAAMAELVALQDPALSKESKKLGLQRFLDICRKTPEILIITDFGHEETLIETFLDQQDYFPGAWFGVSLRDFYLDVFGQLLRLVPKTQLGDSSPFDYQDSLGFNFLMHVVKYNNIALLECYLSHPSVKAHMNFDFVDPYTHFNVFCVVYGLINQGGSVAESMALTRTLVQHGMRFTIDHLIGVLRYVEPALHAKDPYQHLKQAIIDFKAFRKETLDSLEQGGLKVELARLPALACDPMIERVLKDLFKRPVVKLQATSEKTISPTPFLSSVSAESGSLQETREELAVDVEPPGIPLSSHGP